MIQRANFQIDPLEWAQTVQKRRCLSLFETSTSRKCHFRNWTTSGEWLTWNSCRWKGNKTMLFHTKNKRVSSIMIQITNWISNFSWSIIKRQWAMQLIKLIWTCFWKSFVMTNSPMLVSKNSIHCAICIFICQVRSQNRKTIRTTCTWSYQAWKTAKQIFLIMIM